MTIKFYVVYLRRTKDIMKWEKLPFRPSPTLVSISILQQIFASMGASIFALFCRWWSGCTRSSARNLSMPLLALFCFCFLLFNWLRGNQLGNILFRVWFGVMVGDVCLVVVVFCCKLWNKMAPIVGDTFFFFLKNNSLPN